MSELRAKEGATPPRYVPVRPSTLVLDSKPPFDLFVRINPSEPMVLFRKQSAAFTKEARDRLKQDGGELVYVRDADEPRLHQYVEKHLSAIVANDELDSAAKAALLYGAAVNVMKNAFENPSSTPALARTRPMVEALAAFVLRDEQAYPHLIQNAQADYALPNHSVNVCVMSLKLASVLNVKDFVALADIGQGALLHDLGKSQIDSAILDKPGPLSDSEWKTIQEHPKLACDLLTKAGVKNATVLDVVRHHHERVNGGGYPDNLSGVKVSPAARICSICDRFDALTSGRTFRDAIPTYEAFQILGEHEADQIDVAYFKQFIRVMGPKQTSTRRHLYSSAKGEA